MCTNGRCFERAALVGADGIRSRTRAQPPMDTWPFARSCRWVKSLRTFTPVSTSYPLRHGTLFNIAGVFRRSVTERGDVVAYRVELEQAYRNAHPTMKALLSMLDLERAKRSRPPCDGEGRHGCHDARRCLRPLRPANLAANDTVVAESAVKFTQLRAVVH